MSTLIFRDQQRFMHDCGQTTEEFNIIQLNLYHRLVKEECGELDEAMVKLLSQASPSVQNVAEVADALLDTIVVCIGALYSMGLDPSPLWNEVSRANDDKRDPITGKVLKRDDGKIMKPEGWRPPYLGGMIRQQLEGKIK